MLVGSFKYVAPWYYSPCATDLQRPILISYSKASLSLVKNGPPIMRPPIMSPSDLFMAAYVVVVVRFYFLFFFLAQVATKNRILVLFLWTTKLYMLSWVFLLLWVLISFLLCNTKKLS